MARHAAVRLALPIALVGACSLPQAPIAIPAQLVPAGEREIARIPSRGVLVFECRAIPQDASKFAWTYVAADVELHDSRGRPVGRHTALPPVWQASDGSRISGTVKDRAEAPRKGDAPWLLVATRSTGGDGVLAAVTSLQRINTVGGGPPPDPCDAGASGKRVNVPLDAEYVLFAR